MCTFWVKRYEKLYKLIRSYKNKRKIKLPLHKGNMLYIKENLKMVKIMFICHGNIFLLW